MSRAPRTAALVALAACGALAGCGGTTYEQPHAPPTLAEVLARLAERRAAATAFSHTATMDFWSGDERVETTVYAMGTAASADPAAPRGARLRLNVLDPVGGSTLADMACDGSDFVVVDYRRDCQLSGPCNQDSIAGLLRVRLSPEDFVLLALGQPAILPGPLKGAVSWDDGSGRWVVELAAADGRRQRLELSGDADRRWDVARATVKDAGGALEWELTQKSFDVVASADRSSTLRVPRKLRFEQPAVGKAPKADLIVEWDERALAPALGAEKFALAPPAGLPRCR